MQNFFFYFNCICLFFTAQGLLCFAQACSSCSQWGLLFIMMLGLLIVVVSFAEEHRLQASGVAAYGLSSFGFLALEHRLISCGTWAQQLWYTGLVVPWHMEPSQTRDRTHVLCIGKRTLFFLINLFLTEGQLLYRILLFSVKRQHESAIGIHMSRTLEPPSHLPPHPTPLG